MGKANISRGAGSRHKNKQKMTRDAAREEWHYLPADSMQKKSYYHTSRRAPSERGGILIEFLVISPVIIIMLLGTLGLGLAFRQQTLLFESVRVAGRALAAIEPESVSENDGTPVPVGELLCDTAVDLVKRALTVHGIQADDFKVQVSPVDLSSDPETADFNLCDTLTFTGATLSITPQSGFLRFFGAIVTRGAAQITVPLQSRYPIKGTPCNG